MESNGASFMNDVEYKKRLDQIITNFQIITEQIKQTITTD